MPATITWHAIALGVENKTVDGHGDLVSVVYWECNGEQDVDGVVYTSKLERNTVIPYNPAHHYIAFADLTEAEVLEWIWEQGTVKADTEAEIQSMLDAQVSPAIVTPGLPWVL